MHPRVLARADCSGGTCPAVYDDDPDLAPDELAIVGKDAGGPLFAKLSDRIARDETLVTIKRDLVAEALRPADEPVEDAEFWTPFEMFSYSAFRLETYQTPVGTARDDEWVAQLRASRRWRKVHQRVRVVIEPLSGALEEELTDGYGPNVAAGEDIRVIPVAAGGHWPADVPPSDWWLFDSSALYVMHYQPDGEWAGASRVRDPWRIVGACRARDAALNLATPWKAYIASRPDLQRRLAQ